MKIYKLTMYLHEFEGNAIENLQNTIDHDDYITANITSVESIDIGEWHDNHPTNYTDTNMDEWWEKERGQK